MRDLIYYIATSIDGFIAEEDGSFAAFPWDDAFGADIVQTFPETIPVHLWEALGVQGDNKWFVVVLMGRKTYEVGLEAGITNPYATLKSYVFSRTMKESPDADVTLISDNAVEVVRDLKQEAGKGIWLCGGGALAATLYKANLIDTLILKVNPLLLGSGIPLFTGGVPLANLELTDSKVYRSGHVRLHYRVKKIP